MMPQHHHTKSMPAIRKNNSNTNLLAYPVLQQVISASTGAMITSLSMTPLDVVRTRMQVQNKSTSTFYYANTMDAIRKIARAEGVTTLWRGLTPSLVMQVPSAGVYYASYETLKAYFKQHSSINEQYLPLFAGCTARIFSATISTPFEYIRTLVQSQTGNVWQQLNWKQLRTRMFTGVLATLMRDAPFSAMYWFGYENMKAALLAREHSSDALVHFICGASSGTIAAIVTTPIDVIKTQIQSSTTEKKRIIQTAKEIYKQDGILGFARGLTPRIAKVAPACAIMITSYEFCKRFFEQQNKSDDFEVNS